MLLGLAPRILVLQGLRSSATRSMFDRFTSAPVIAMLDVGECPTGLQAKQLLC